MSGVLKYGGMLVLIVAALLGAAYFARDTPAAAKAGDCAHNAGTESKPDVSLVDCGSADAEFTVLKVVHGADEHECETEPALVATYVETRRSSVLVLCLGMRERPTVTPGPGNARHRSPTLEPAPPGTGRTTTPADGAATPGDDDRADA
ncbi:hypothetical protein ACFYS8_17405 [Kitasatospora sp. NPDC004615]|uniref:LppU/SCO3897 family protein n=1 Tax=Kitasatospora sp. NPDC004615 TaxID=3364017 RepID=UPI0036BCF578